MTLPEFLEALRGTPRDWWITMNGCIRRPWCQCPISSLNGYSAKRWRSVAEARGISDALADKIVNAADNSRGHDPVLRRQLLDACGLREHAS